LYCAVSHLDDVAEMCDERYELVNLWKKSKIKQSHAQRVLLLFGCPAIEKTAKGGFFYGLLSIS
jgi:hypothetical protein